MPAKLIGVHRTFQYYRCKSLQAHYNDYNAPQYLSPHNKNQTSHSVLESLTVQELMRLQMSQVTHKLPMFEFIQHAHLTNSRHPFKWDLSHRQASNPTQALVFIFSKPSSSSLNFDKAELKAPIYSFAQLSLFAAIFFYYELKHNIPHTHTHMSIYMYTTSKFHNSLKDVKA